MNKPNSAPTPTQNLPVDSFAKLVEECRKNRDTRIIENTSMAHASVLLKNLLILASDENTDVHLVSGCLEPAVYNYLVDDVQAVLAKGRAVQVVALCDLAQLRDNKFYNTVVAHRCGKVISLPEKRENLHFLVTDHAYRVEVDDSVKKAYASFNDQGGVMTEVLKQNFAELWSSGGGACSDKERVAGERDVSRPVGAH